MFIGANAPESYTKSNLNPTIAFVCSLRKNVSEAKAAPRFVSPMMPARGGLRPPDGCSPASGGGRDARTPASGGGRTDVPMDSWKNFCKKRGIPSRDQKDAASLVLLAGPQVYRCCQTYIEAVSKQPGLLSTNVSFSCGSWRMKKSIA